MEKYIKRITNPETGEEEIWLENFVDIDSLLEIYSTLLYNKNIYINENIGFQYEDFNKPIIFNNIIFNKDLSFLFSTFKDYIHFNNCTFRNNLNFSFCSFEKEVKFINCNFNFNISFWRALFKSTVVFSESIFKGKETIFRDCSFFNDTFFEKTQIFSEIGFQNATFGENVYFKGAILENIDFSGAKFIVLEQNKDFTIKNLQRREINFSNVFFGIASFENTSFEKNVRFHESIFKENANFSNTSFKKLVDFYLVCFEKEQQFHLTDFLYRAIFSNTTFKKEVQFLYNKTESNTYISFESAILKKGLDISRSNFNCNLNFWNITIEEKGINDIFNLLSNNVPSEKLRYIDDFGEHKMEAVPSVYKQIRESFRIIKDNFYTQNNKIEGLKFHEREMSVYLKEKSIQDNNLKDKTTKNSIRKEFWKQIFHLKKNYREINIFISNLFDIIKVFFLIIAYFLFFITCVFLSPLLFITYSFTQFLNLKIFCNMYFKMKFTIYLVFHNLNNLKKQNGSIVHTLFFLPIISFLLIHFLLYKIYISYWIMLPLSFLWFYSYIYPIKNKIKKNIKDNNYMSFILLLIPFIFFFILLYGKNNYQENDYVYKKIKHLLSFFNSIKEDNPFYFLFISELTLIFFAILLIILREKQDKILLWFNKNSNTFGTDWVVGINYTLFVTLISTTIILSLSSNIDFLPNLEGIGNFLRSLVEMLNITEWKEIEILGERPNNWQYILIFLARIFIAYGIYQTIQAFRKFGKS
jgi:putative membrane protein